MVFEDSTVKAITSMAFNVAFPAYATPPCHFQLVPHVIV
jgi:hypothetical protein